MKKSKSKNSKKTKINKVGLAKPRQNTPFDINDASFQKNASGPLVLGQLSEWFDKDVENKSIKWFVFQDKIVENTGDFDMRFEFIEFNNLESDWDWAPHVRYRSRKLKAVRYEKY